MTWFYGFWLKNRYVKRIAEEFGYPYNDLAALNFRIDKYIKRTTKASFFLNFDYRQRTIVAFVETRRRGNLSDLKSTPEQIKAVSLILHGDEQEHKPRWYTDDPYDAPSEDEPLDDDPRPMKPMEYYKRFLPQFFPDSEVSNPTTVRSTTCKGNSARHKAGVPRSGTSGSTDEDASPGRRTLTKKLRMERRKVKVISAGRRRKIQRIKA